MTALLCLLLASLPWFEGGADPTGLFLTHTLVMALVAAALVSAAVRGVLELRAGWEAAAGLALVAACVVSFLRVDYRFGSFLTVWNVIIACLLAGALMMAPAVRPLRPARVVAAMAAAQAILALTWTPAPNMTPSATFANANHLAAYLVIGTLLGAGLARRAWEERDRGGPAWPAMPWAGAAVLCASALLRIGSRGALVSLLGAGTVWALRTPPRGRRARAAMALLGLAIVAVSIAAVSSRFRRIEDPYRFDRVRIWEASLRAAADHPITGLGPGMFSRRSAPYNFPQDSAMFRWAKTPSSTHSTLLEALVETGAPGLAASLLFAVALTLAAWRAAGRPDDPVSAAIALALPACLLQAVVDTPFDAPAITLTLLALVWPLVRPSSSGEAAWGVRWSWEPRSPRARAAAAAALAGLVCAHAAAVGVPYAAHALYRRAERQADPLPAISRAGRLEPWNPLYPATRAEMIARRGAPLDPAALAQAHLDLRAAHRLDPGDPDHLLALGRLHARACFDLACDAASAARAERYYREAIASGRKDPRPHVELAGFLMSVGRPADAVGLLEQAVVLEPRFAQAWLDLARARSQLPGRQGAVDALERVTRVRQELKGYVPRNGYERDLMRLDTAGQEDLLRRLARQDGG